MYDKAVPCVPVIIQRGWWIEQHMALTDVAVSIRCARLLICNQSDKVMCGDTLSFTVDQINRLSLPLRLSVPHFPMFPSPPHPTTHFLSSCFFVSLSFFWPCIAKKNIIIIFAIFAITYSTSIFVWVSAYLFTADKLFQDLVPMSTDSPLSKAISCLLSKVRWLAEIMRKSYIIIIPQHHNRLFL